VIHLKKIHSREDQVLNDLNSCKTDEKTMQSGCRKIGNHFYDLTWKGHRICVRAYAHLWMLSRNTVRLLATNGRREDLREIAFPVHPHEPTRTGIVITFIRQLAEDEFWSTPSPSQPGVRHLHGFASKNEVRREMANFGNDYIVSKSTFYKAWKKIFPTLYPDNDRPGCSVCIDLQTKIRKADPAESISLKEEYKEHLWHARALVDESLNYRMRCQMPNSDAISICMDFMSKKFLPHPKRSSTAYFNKNPGMIIVLLSFTYCLFRQLGRCRWSF